LAVIKDLLSRILEHETAPAPPVAPRRMAALGRYSAVIIVPGGHCCLAATTAGLQKILSVEAPKLPLTECSMPERCRCRYRKYDDRRESHGERRAAGVWQPMLWDQGEERREKRGRRNKDR
jgi:hypothetical protein